FFSLSRWNDGFASMYTFTCTKRSVIEQDVHWVQIRDQNRLLSFGRYGRPSTPEEFKPYFWMRDSHSPKVRWLWERMLVSTRPDPSDAGMTYFLVTGDEACDPIKLRRLIEEHRVPTPTARQTVRIEAENFRYLDGCALEDRSDKLASHELDTRPTGGTAACIHARFDEPFVENSADYDVEVRYFDAKNMRCRFALSTDGIARGAAWESPGEGRGWSSQMIRDVTVNVGDEIRVEVQGGGGESGRLDYVQLNPRSAAASAAYFPPPEAAGGWRTLVPVNAEPSAEQKRQVREHAGLDWDALAQAWRYTASFKTPNNLLIIRHGWIAGEWSNFANPRGIASCTK
ncbi:MAG: hypothetical protein JJ992_24570, partial [Planctomycetes bacterium]|nr:hypothetical protein [Planctomycetota bacterium]